MRISLDFLKIFLETQDYFAKLKQNFPETQSENAETQQKIAETQKYEIFPHLISLIDVKKKPVIVSIQSIVGKSLECFKIFLKDSSFLVRVPLNPPIECFKAATSAFCSSVSVIFHFFFKLIISCDNDNRYCVNKGHFNFFFKLIISCDNDNRYFVNKGHFNFFFKLIISCDNDNRYFVNKPLR